MTLLLAILLAAAEPQSWYARAMELHQSGQYAEAVDAFDKAWEKGERVTGFMYNRACAEARAGKTDKAFEHLRIAAKNGFATVDLLRKDEDLASLRKDARFGELLAKAEETQHPCKKAPHAMAFWIGEWDVADPKGNKLGSSSVQSILDGCVVLENWTAANGTQGKSFNIWDREMGKWRQTWVDDKGRQTDYVGDKSGESIAYVGKVRGGDDALTSYRMTFTPLPGGKVRQFFEQETDKGWIPTWEGIYSPHSRQASDR